MNPLPASSPLLRERRYVVDILGARNEHGGYPVIASGRFPSMAAAVAWADAEHAAADSVVVTFYTARRGWVSQLAGRRKGGRWQ